MKDCCNLGYRGICSWLAWICLGLSAWSLEKYIKYEWDRNYYPSIRDSIRDTLVFYMEWRANKSELFYIGEDNQRNYIRWEYDNTDLTQWVIDWTRKEIPSTEPVVCKTPEDAEIAKELYLALCNHQMTHPNNPETFDDKQIIQVVLPFNLNRKWRGRGIQVSDIDVEI